MQMRKGKEYYGPKYDKALLLHEEGKSIADISKELGISYSAAYHWIRGIRKPHAGNMNEFFSHIKENGPLSSLEIAKKFPKHNELFLMSSRRGYGIKRAYLGKKYKELATWYYTGGQEKKLEERISELQKKIRDLRDKMVQDIYM